MRSPSLRNRLILGAGLALVIALGLVGLALNAANHRGAVTFAAMATTFAVITAVYCLLLCAFAGAVSARVKAHQGLARGLERLAGVFLVGFGIRLGAQ